MKLLLTVTMLLVVGGMFSLSVLAQADVDALQRADEMRVRLLELHAKEAELGARARQLDEQLKPENIERSLAGIGSTKPEELRELRRRQLTVERDGVAAQLKLVEKSRERLEAGIAKADAAAYHKSAEVTPPVTQILKAESVKGFRWPVAILSAVMAVGIFVVIVSFRKLSLR